MEINFGFHKTNFGIPNHQAEQEVHRVFRKFYSPPPPGKGGFNF